jgi:hypothetical protein
MQAYCLIAEKIAVLYELVSTKIIAHYTKTIKLCRMRIANLTIPQLANKIKCMQKATNHNYFHKLYVLFTVHLDICV